MNVCVCVQLLFIFVSPLKIKRLPTTVDGPDTDATSMGPLGLGPEADHKFLPYARRGRRAGRSLTPTPVYDCLPRTALFPRPGLLASGLFSFLSNRELRPVTVVP